MPLFYVKIRKNIDICNYLPIYYPAICRGWGTFSVPSIGVEMMPAGTDVDCGWVYINKVGLRCMNVFSRRAACWGEDAAKSLVSFQGSVLCGGAWWWMLPRAHSPESAAIKRRARLLWMTPSLIATLTA